MNIFKANKTHRTLRFYLMFGKYKIILSLPNICQHLPKRYTLQSADHKDKQTISGKEKAILGEPTYIYSKHWEILEFALNP